MIRALARESYAPVDPGDYVDAPGRPSSLIRGAHGADSSGRDCRSPPRGRLSRPPRASTATWATSRTSPWPAASTCLFTRVSPFGIEGIAQKLAERRQLALEHARQWLVHVGLEKPIAEIEGDAETIAAARDALAEGAARLVDELRLSLEYYAAQEGAVPIEGVVACGPGNDHPGTDRAPAARPGLRFEDGRPRRLAHLDESTARAPDPVLRPRPGGVERASGQPDSTARTAAASRRRCARARSPT